MDSAATDSAGDLDPRIQVELESLNTATDEINKLEIELEEANSTFRILLNESTRRLKLLSKKLGGCIEKSRGYHEARECLRQAQLECQAATLKFRRANEIYVAAKETVALAEQQFMTNSHEWQFDNAWQEMLNHATIKVMTAEQQKTECHAEHYRLAEIFSAAEQKVSQLEDRFRRSIRKSQPYFESKQICQDQLHAQKQRILELQQLTKQAKARYSGALANLEHISEDIHRKRSSSQANNDETPNEDSQQQTIAAPQPQPPTSAPTTPPPPQGRREPGVGADEQSPPSSASAAFANSSTSDAITAVSTPSSSYTKFSISTLDVNAELDRCCISDSHSMLSRATSLMNVGRRSPSTSSSSTASQSPDCSTPASAGGASVTGATSELDLERLRHRVRELAVRPVEGGDGRQTQDAVWETELNETVNQLDRLMMMRENGMKYIRQKSQTCMAAVQSSVGGGGGSSCSSSSSSSSNSSDIVEESAPSVEERPGGEPVRSVVAPLLQRWSNEIAERTKRFQLGRRSSLE